MKNKSKTVGFCSRNVPLFILLLVSSVVFAQDPVPVDGAGNSIVLDDFVDASAAGNADAASADNAVIRYGAIDTQLPVFTGTELEQFVGPIALYPDDLLAIILPASTYPLQIVLAARFLEQLEADSNLQPDESWDESVIALLNYPEVIQMMNADIQWTWQLGEAVVSQEADVLSAINSFRELAYDAGNLKSDAFQAVSNSDDTIVITQASESVVYVPYYVPAEVVVSQSEPVYHYYPTAYPVYYYPYAAGHRFRSDYFWGVTTAFGIGWSDHHLHVFHHSYNRHPYFGRSYYAGHHYRRPSLSAFNRSYDDYGYRNSRDRTRGSSYWRPQRNSGARPSDRRFNDRIYSARDGRSVSVGNSGDRNRNRNRRVSRAGNDDRVGVRGGNRAGNLGGNTGDRTNRVGPGDNPVTTASSGDSRSTGVTPQSPRRRGNRRGRDNAAAPVTNAFANSSNSARSAPAVIEGRDGTGNRARSRSNRTVADRRQRRGRTGNPGSNPGSNQDSNRGSNPVSNQSSVNTARATTRNNRRSTAVNHSQRVDNAERSSSVIGQTPTRQRAAPQARRTKPARTTRRSSAAAPAAQRSSRPAAQNTRSAFAARRSAPAPRQRAQNNRRANRAAVRQP
jgi:hypothetical protein